MKRSARQNAMVISAIKGLSENDFRFAEEYLYSDIVNYILDYVTDKERARIELDIASNRLLKERVEETHFLINAYEITDYQEFQVMMKRNYCLEV